MFEEVRDHLRQLEACGVIRPSKSQYSSPVVGCRKNDGKLRLCVDYRLLNSRTRKDNCRLPRVDEYKIPSGEPSISAALISSPVTTKLRFGKIISLTQPSLWVPLGFENTTGSPSGCATVLALSRG
ncbi:Pol polyprotein [Elysia marginata]|uniref:Pol polyprotein n=1 Tax=Elysia marginata TaxID=1093978 RepID=A0AAV4GAX0_9GAST|nr:Pol polyprotein [Elysia marginata]